MEAAAEAIRLVRDHGSKRAEMIILTESQEGGNDTDELHCGCCCGGFSRRRSSEWIGWRVERMEGGRETGERWPFLNIFQQP